MIGVIADDFSGAAEIGGLGLVYGLTVEICTVISTPLNADLLIVATDTRSMGENQAGKETKKIAEQLFPLHFDWIYKKTDSVMRGHILVELIALLKAYHKEKALLVPSNPALGRIIADGKYYINKKPLHETGFSEDPEFSISTSDVLSLLGKSKKIETCILKKGQRIPERCIAIGEAKENIDLKYWASFVRDEIIPTGAAAFFEELLLKKGFKRIKPKKISFPDFGPLSLYVLGSAYSNTRHTVREAKENGCYVSEMPDELFYAKKNRSSLVDRWVCEILAAFKTQSRVVIAINQPPVNDAGFAQQLRKEIAVVVKKIHREKCINEFFLEGGSTSFGIIQALKFNRFVPTQKLSPGVIRMEVINSPDVHITIKPGSYVWPEKIWNCHR